MEETISLNEIVLVLRKRMFMILSITIGAAFIAAIISFFFITPVYESTTQILVNQKKKDNSALQYNDVQTNVQLINTYNVIIKSPAILSKVKNKLHLGMSVKQLTSKISVGSEKQSQVLTVTVKDSNPNTATAIANTIAETFKEEAVGLMSVDNVNILSQAENEVGQAPVKPQKLLNIGIAIVVGLMASSGLAMLLEYLDKTIKKEQDIEAILGLPVLGTISQMEEENRVDAAITILKAKEHSIS